MKNMAMKNKRNTTNEKTTYKQELNQTLLSTIHLISERRECKHCQPPSEKWSVIYLYFCMILFTDKTDEDKCPSSLSFSFIYTTVDKWVYQLVY